MSANRIVRQELVTSFKKDFPEVDIKSGAGTLMFQGYVTGYRRANCHRDSMIKEQKTKLEEKEITISNLESHIASMSSYIKGVENALSGDSDGKLQ